MNNNHNAKHDLNQINALLQQSGVVSAGKVNWFAEIDSTNRWLMERPDIHGEVCITELQTAGRGSRGRSWQAPRSSSVLLSIGWTLTLALNANANANASAGLSLVSGLAILDGLHQLGIDSVGLKWPNDLLATGEKHGGKKIGGVLTELKGTNAVVGMGINVNMPPAAHWSEQAPIDSAWIDLKSLGHEVERDELAAALIVSHCHYLPRFCDGGFAQFADEWNRRNVHHGKSVSVSVSVSDGLPNESFSGIVQGADHDGALLIEQNGSQRRLLSGEVTLLR